jgi:diaminopimelate epimerase
MNLKFIKYQGAGNDFILVDNRQRLFDNLDVKSLCHPKFGIGADGLMLLQNVSGYDFEMVYYNSDGNKSTMCGNGGRCIVDFAHSLDIVRQSTTFKAIDGRHDALWSEDNVELQMKEVDVVEQLADDFELNTGSPHYVSFISNLEEKDIVGDAKKIRYSEPYLKEGINVNFVEIIDHSNIKVRTYERGVENETLSCGTGVTASAICLSRRLGFKDGEHLVHIQTPGGHLSVRFTLANGRYIDVWLIGPARKVYEGIISI